MKHYQLILAAALVALAACNKGKVENNNTASDNEIGFNAVARKATKANNAIISGSTYATDGTNSFNVWGWLSQTGNLNTDAALTEGLASNFMSGLKIEWTKGYETENHEEAWRNKDNYYYWPLTGAISFLAIHPSTVTPTSTGWDATHKKPQASIENYTITPATNETVDLMMATNWGSREAVTATSNKLNMVFQHALSQIVINVKTDDDYTHDIRFDVNSVQFNGIDLSGDVTYINEAFSWSDNGDQTQNWMYYNTKKSNIDNVASIYGAAKVMIPQPANKTAPAEGEPGDPEYVPADNTKTTITIGYTMQQKPADQNAEISGTVTVDAPWLKVKEGSTDYDSPQTITGWEPGKKYVYTLNFKLNEILFDPEVTDWVEVEMNTTTIYE